MHMSPEIVVALIAAVPATIAAFASWTNKKKQDRQLTPSNGHTVVQMIEDIWAEITIAKQHRDQLDIKDETLRGEIHAHANRLKRMDEKWNHKWEEHEGVCPQCLTLTDGEDPKQEDPST